MWGVRPARLAQCAAPRRPDPTKTASRPGPYSGPGRPLSRLTHLVSRPVTAPRRCRQPVRSLWLRGGSRARRHGRARAATAPSAAQPLRGRGVGRLHVLHGSAILDRAPPVGAGASKGVAGTVRRGAAVAAGSRRAAPSPAGAIRSVAT